MRSAEPRGYLGLIHIFLYWPEMQMLGDLLFPGLLEGEKGFDFDGALELEEKWRALIETLAVSTQQFPGSNTGALETWSCLFYETLNVGMIE